MSGVDRERTTAAEPESQNGPLQQGLPACQPLSRGKMCDHFESGITKAVFQNESSAAGASSSAMHRFSARALLSPPWPWTALIGASLSASSTHWATNSAWIPRPLCDPKSCASCELGVHIRSAQKGPSRGKSFSEDRFSTDDLHAYPEQLCREIFDHCQGAR